MFRSRYYALRKIKDEVDKVQHLKNMFSENTNVFVAKQRGYYFATNMLKYHNNKVLEEPNCGKKNCVRICDCFQYYSLNSRKTILYKINSN